MYSVDRAPKGAVATWSPAASPRRTMRLSKVPLVYFLVTTVDTSTCRPLWYLGLQLRIVTSPGRPSR